MIFSALTPSKTINFLRKTSPWLGSVFIIFLILGLYYALVKSPIDYQQGEMVRLMYVHVPASWWCMSIYVFMAICAALGFVTKHPLLDLIVKAAAPVGATNKKLSRSCLAE